MERKVSDLLDWVRADDVDLKPAAPLSARRIRERTMGQVEKRRPVGVRWLGRVAAVAAIIAALTFTVFAVDTIFYDGELFNNYFDKELSEDQAELVDDISRSFDGSMTYNGSTITPIRAIADEKMLYLYLRVEAPENVVLPDYSEESGLYYSFVGRDLDTLKVIGSLGDVSYQMSVSSSTTTLPDDDPTDNVKEFVLRLSSDSDFFTFNGHWKKTLIFDGLYVQENFGICEKILSAGFAFDISISYESTKVEIDTGGVSFYNEEYDYTTTVKKVTISSLSVDVEYTHTTPNNKYIFPKGGPIQIVMKDGTIVEAVDAYYDAAAHSYPHPDSVVGVVEYSVLDEPVVVENIDYIIIGGEHIFDVN